MSLSWECAISRGSNILLTRKSSIYTLIQKFSVQEGRKEGNKMEERHKVGTNERKKKEGVREGR